MIELTGGPLYQWDTGRNVSISQGPTSINALQFANQGDSQAVTVSIGDDDTVRIPDRYLMTGKPLVVYGVRINENSDVMETYGVKVFPVKGKAKPKDYVPTAAEEAYGVVKKLSDEAKEAAKDAEQAKNSAQTYAQDAGYYAQDADDYAKNAYHFATNAKASADKAAEEVKKLDPLIVDLNVANYDLPDVLAALAAGRDVQLHVEDLENVPDGMYRLIGVASDSALFATEEDGMLIVIHFHEGPQIDAYNYPLDLLDDKKEDSSHTWSSKKILEMIAQGGTGDINMSNRSILCGGLRTWELAVESEEDGFSIKAEQVDGDYNKPSALFYGWHAYDPVILRNIAEGTQDHDAVNKRQMETALAKKAKIDDTKIGDDAWSSKNIIDKLCPHINETGLLVQCEPVEGYPLEVQAEESGEEPGVTVTVCGKNLYDETTYPLSTDGYPYKKIGNFAKSNNYKRTGFIPVQHLAGQTITLNYAPVSATNPGMAFYTRIPNVDSVDDCKDAFCGGGSGYNTNVPADAVYMCFCVAVGDKDKDIQIEIGNKDTDYEPYSENTFTATDEASGAFIPVSGIVGQSGLTTIFAYDGEGKATEVKVFGRADPVAMINALVNRVADLEEATINNT